MSSGWFSSGMIISSTVPARRFQFLPDEEVGGDNEYQSDDENQVVPGYHPIHDGRDTEDAEGDH
jgi:hypothetical protein